MNTKCEIRSRYRHGYYLIAVWVKGQGLLSRRNGSNHITFVGNTFDLLMKWLLKTYSSNVTLTLIVYNGAMTWDKFECFDYLLTN